MKKSLLFVLITTLFLSFCPAQAKEDGQDSLFSGIAATLGITQDTKPAIDYQERSKLAVPDHVALPPPHATRKPPQKADSGGPSAREVSDRGWTLIHPGQQNVKVTIYDANPPGVSCRVPDPKTSACPEAPHPSINWNPLTWVGIQSKPKIELGAEPERQDLLDPPYGYRTPAEGVGVKIDN